MLMKAEMTRKGRKDSPNGTSGASGTSGRRSAKGGRSAPAAHAAGRAGTAREVVLQADPQAVARAFLLEPGGLVEADLERAIGRIFEHRVDYADLYFQYTRSEGWSLDEGIVKSGSFSIGQGVGLCLFGRNQCRRADVGSRCHAHDCEERPFGARAGGRCCWCGWPGVRRRKRAWCTGVCAVAGAAVTGFVGRCSCEWPWRPGKT